MLILLYQIIIYLLISPKLGQSFDLTVTCVRNPKA